MSEDESFNSFYSKLNGVVIGQFNLCEKKEDLKIVRKILRSLLESFHAEVTAIEESKDLDDIKVQELIGSLQTYELSLPSQRKSKSLALKTINERIDAYDSLDEDEVDKDVTHVVKNFQKFLKFKKNGKFAEKGKFQNLEKEKKDFKRKKGKESQSSQGITSFECNRHRHLRKECPNYLRRKARLEELGEHTKLESIGIVEESKDEEDEGTMGLQETYNSLLKKIDEYGKVAKAAIKKMKKAKQDYRSLLVRYKETKSEMEMLNEELTEAYSNIKFLELEVVQANAEVERASSKKLDEVLTYQKPFSGKSGLGYTRDSSSVANISKELKFMKIKEPMVATTAVEKVNVEKKRKVNDQQVLIKPHNQSVMSPTKHSAMKKSSKCSPNNFKSIEADLKYNDSYKRAMIIMERVVKLDTLEDTFIPEVFKERTWKKLLNPVGVVLGDHKGIFPQCLEMSTLAHVMIHNLYSVTNRMKLFASRTIFLCDLFTHKEIDICGHIFHLLKRSIEKKNSRIIMPFSSLIMGLIAKSRLKLPSDLTMVQRDYPIGAHTVTQRIVYIKGYRASVS
ncbi:uncharacterized protein LOC136068138 [Quercus suber]|uniref:uncharacterized protein LOC136068138 n=1 Tax=Quercus suber TaxID=58331 RepID=UPI0032DF4D92